MLPKKADIVIIGAGVIGASIAYQLAKRNQNVVVLERSDLVGGSSGACGGMVFLQSKSPGPHLNLALESVKRFQDLENELEADIEFQNNGGMIVIETEEQLEAIKQFVEKQKKSGLDVSLLDRQQARDRAPALSEAIIGSTFSPMDGQVHPIFLTFAFINAAQKRGARLFTDTLITGIGKTAHAVTSVKTNRGEIETNVIVNAAGIHAPEIGAMAGLEIPIRPRRGQLLVTEAVEPVISTCILSAQYIAAKFDPSLAEKGGGGTSIEQTANGNMILGSTREFVGFDSNTTFEAIRTILAKVTSMIPAVKDMHIIRTFAGLRPYTPDGLPILGRVDALDGFYMAAGHEGDGIALSAITGEILADLIVDNHEIVPLDVFRLERFG